MLTDFKQSYSTQILDHIHEWRRHRRLVKIYVTDQLLTEWFTKSLLAPITKDVAKGGVVTEEQLISHVQYLDLVYTQSGMLYDKIPNAPRPSNIVPPLPCKESHVVDGIIGSTSLQTVSKPSGISPPAYAQNP